MAVSELVATDPTGLPAPAVAGTLISPVGSLSGEVFAYLSRTIAGEDLTVGPNGVLAIVPEPLASVSVHALQVISATLIGTIQLAIKNSAGRLYSLTAYNQSAGLLYFFLVNKAAAAINNDPPHWCVIPVPAGGIVSFGVQDWGEFGLPFGTGIQGVWSTTPNLVTLAAAGGQMSGAFA